MKRITQYLDLMSESEVLLIHQNSLRILAEIGLKIPNREVM